MSQVKRTLVTMAGFAVVAAALGLYAWFGVLKGGQKADAAKKAAQEIFPAAHDEGPAAPSHFQKLVVAAKGQTTTLEHTQSGWEITSPLKAPADEGVVKALVGALSHDAFSHLVEAHASAEELKKFGLGQPKFTVTATYRKDGASPQTFRLEGGILDPYDSTYYVRRGTEPAVHSVSTGFRDAVAQSTFQLRDKQLLHLQAKDLESIALARGGTALSLKNEGQHWYLTEPLDVRADDAAVKALVNAARNHHVESFPKQNADSNKAFGLDSPVLTVTFTPKKGEPVKLTVSEVGEKSARRAFVRFEQGGQPVVAEVSASLVDALKKGPDDLRDHTVLDFDQDRVLKVSFRAAGAEDGAALTVERTADANGKPSQDWKVTSPKRGKAKKWKMSSVLWALHTLKAEGFGAEHPSKAAWAKNGIDAHARSVTLFGKGGTVLAKLVVGSKAEGDKQWARGSRDQLLEIDPSKLTELPTSVKDLLDTSAAKASAQP